MNNRDSDERARELLSSYLDGDCTPAEKAFVEERLAQSQALREELDELRMTVDALHHLPEVPLPRSFYITEAMLEARKPHPLFSWMIPALRGLRVASGAVALSLVSVLLLAVLTQNAVQPAPASAPASAPAPAPAFGSAQASTPEAQKSAPQVGGAQAPQPTPAAASGPTPAQDTTQAPPMPPAAASSTASSSATQTGANSTMPLAPPSTPTATNREMQPAGAAPQASPTPEPDRVQTFRQPATAEPAHASSSINLWEVAGGLAVLLLVLLVTQAIIARRV